MTKKRIFERALKERTVNDWVSGRRTAAQICKEERISTGQLSQWRADIAPNIPAPGRKKSLEESAAARPSAPEPAPAPALPPPAPAAIHEPASDARKKGTRHSIHAQYAAAIAFKGGGRNGGRPKDEVAREYGVSSATIQAWWLKWKNQPPPPGGEVSGTPARANALISHLDLAHASIALDEAVTLTREIGCPNCHARFSPEPPTLPECLLLIAWYRLAAGRR